MKSRAEIKAEARASISAKYWPVVGISLLGTVIIGGISAIPGVGGLLSLLIGTIIIVGLMGFNIAVYRREELKVESLFTPFNRYGRVLGGMLWMYLWQFLWSLIAIVPYIIVVLFFTISAIFSSGGEIMSSVLQGGGAMSGMPDFAGLISLFNPSWLWLFALLFVLMIPAIIKSIAYSFNPYILADSPEIKAIEALDLSKKLTNGYKGKIFITGLSFILWFLPIIAAYICIILSAILLIHALFIIGIVLVIAFAVLYIFYLAPYINTTMAGLYEEIKNNAKQSGMEGTELLR